MSKTKVQPCPACCYPGSHLNMDKLLSAIKQFCKGQKWADESWKNQPHVKPLFDIAKEAEAERRGIKTPDKEVKDAGKTA